MSSQVAALARMRFSGYARSQRVLAPVLATLAVLAVVHNGGTAAPTDAYGFSAMALFGIIAWQSKLAFDTEPDAQRQLSYLSIGSARRDVGAGLVAAALTAVPTVVVAVAAPWVLGAITADSVGGAVALGVWVHLVAAVPAVAVGALASRPITLTRGWGAATLVGATVLVLVLDVAQVKVVRWLVPQLLGPAKAALHGDVLYGVVVSLHALIWSAALVGLYLLLRHRRR
jgi:hypothetical protein